MYDAAEYTKKNRKFGRLDFRTPMHLARKNSIKRNFTEPS